MKTKDRPTILNLLPSLILITFGSIHFIKHGLDLKAIIPILMGSFALYLAVFNHHLLQRIEVLIIKLWYPVGQLITVILLTVTFFVIFVPVGLFLRLFKKDVLNKNFKTNHLSYWLERPKKEQNNYTQQF